MHDVSGVLAEPPPGEQKAQRLHFGPDGPGVVRVRLEVDLLVAQRRCLKQVRRRPNPGLCQEGQVYGVARARIHDGDA